MLVDKIDFVEFDRQWRDLFDDGCDYELVVNGEAAKREQQCLKIPTDNKGGFRYWVLSEAALFLDWAHTRNEEVTLGFRKKPEPLPEGWRQSEKYQWNYSRGVRPKRLDTHLSMHILVPDPDTGNITISSYAGTASLVHKTLQPSTTSPAQAAKQCEEATVAALHELIQEIAHGR